MNNSNSDFPNCDSATPKVVSKDYEHWGFAFRPHWLLSHETAGTLWRLLGRHKLKRLFFSTFPGGWHGVGLLLLRTAVGVTILVQGAVYLDGSGARPISVTAGLGFICVGLMAFIGVFTPVSCTLIGIASCSLAFSWLPVPPTNLLSQGLTTIFFLTMDLALVLIGPGAFSLDARIFGRREIIIPPVMR